MKFFGEPNESVVKYDKRNHRYKPLFVFDKKGEYRTENKKLIKLLKAKFDFQDINYSGMTFQELRNSAKFSTYKMSKKEILKKLKEEA